jgi:hypothetical protein
MMGLEVVVRPVVFPNIRPAPARVLPLPADPTQGQVVINGSSTKTISESYTFSVSVSRQNPKREEVRQYDTVRVYQKTGGDGGSTRAGSGGINRSNYIDVEVLKKVRLTGDDNGPLKMIYAEMPEAENIEILETDMTRSAS